MVTITPIHSMKSALQRWAEAQGIRPNDFAEKTQYSYQHAYNLLRGSANVTDETLGRLARVYGVEAVQEILALSGDGETA